MTVTAAMVAELRDRTGAGMMECKKYLVENNGDMEQAIVSMREHGAAKADKKSGRIAADGAIRNHLASDLRSAVMVEVNSETDFVARDANFLAFASAVAETAFANPAAETPDVLAVCQMAGLEGTVEVQRQQAVAKLGENIQVRRIARLSINDGVIGSYCHGTRIGVLVALQGGNEALAKDLAMHIAANRPLVVNATDVPAALVQSERDIFMVQARESGKPEAIIEKMVEGRVSKYLNEVSLVGQPFVKDPDVTVADVLKKHQATVVSFVRFEVGEGIEKKVDNFVEEVMAQVRGA